MATVTVETPGSGVSPTTRSPRSISPMTRLEDTSGTNGDAHKVRSPLRLETRADGYDTETSSTMVNGEFPFGAPAGAVGPAPTNELMSQGSAEELMNVVPPIAQPSPTAQRLESPSALEQSQSTHKSTASGTEEATGRRSVQFARAAAFDIPNATHSRNNSMDAEDADGGPKSRGFMAKLRAFATPLQPTHTRSGSAWTFSGDNSADQTAQYSPTSERAEASDRDGDADIDESGNELSTDAATRRKKRRKSRRPPADGETVTEPSTPRFQRFAASFRGETPQTTPISAHTTRPYIMPRRATMTEIPEHQRLGMSEDEGRDRLNNGGWRRGFHGPRGISYSALRRPTGTDDTGGVAPRRPLTLRRLTGIAGSSQGADGSPSPWRLRGDRTASISAQKWSQIKAGLKMLARSKKDAVNVVDLSKSAELMAELTAGVPAALMFASWFQRDENGHRRVPVLLEQLKIRITDSHREENRTSDRHTIFRIELEYGNGMTRMKWVISRSLRDFLNLHLKYKADRYIHLRQDDSRRSASRPHFPVKAFPFLRQMRGTKDNLSDEDENDAAGDPVSGPEGDASGTDAAPRVRKRRSSFKLRRSLSAAFMGGPPTPGPSSDAHGRTLSASGKLSKQNYLEKQRQTLETYLQQMIRWLIFRPDSNRLCKFLEVSALGVRLAAEGGYHGKEGLMSIQSGKGIDFRRAWTPALLKDRHRPKWFLVRHSYIVCVDSPEEMHIYDVFLVDSDFSIQQNKKRLRDQNAAELAKTAKQKTVHPSHLTLRLVNSERKVRLLAKNERQLKQFEESIDFMVKKNIWAQRNRFDSFAPVRQNVFAQWLVDGRDYMWNVSRAINMARDVIYIHDWWLSPELYLRRPAAISHRWRLDRLLQKKAEEGVKVFVIMYRNINSAIPIDSEYSKFSLLDLHSNVFVQRSPNQFKQGQFFWAHHEKICIVDHTVAFCGGVDLCFGRWDTPDHPCTDDKPTGFELDDTPRDADHCQLWPGKDYSNPRVQDFYDLSKPYEEMYDRTQVPRMPWHDVGMQIVGQPARDLTRHFIQRWNYILRQRKPTRPTPFLLPPPDFLPAALETLGLQGTCEIQMLRSACAWSLGTTEKTEHSIMNAYVKSIATSDHFVYIENQFFISSTKVDATYVHNGIGDALVERIIRAYNNDEDWRCVVVIPLMPGFQNSVHMPDGTSVRLIMQCQYRSICRGDNSIFGKLRKVGIDPEDYIQFYALRSWGVIGPHRAVTTEQLYIHAKIMIVDDRIAIIGSANINERSMLGSRDSEVAAIVRDTEMIDSYMGGKPYKVGKFPHTMRMRLMREHLGLDIDEIAEEERSVADWEQEMDDFYHMDESGPPSPAVDRVTERKLTDLKHREQEELLERETTELDNIARMHSFNHDIDWEQANNPHLKTNKKVTTDPRVIGNKAHEADVRGEGADHMLAFERRGRTIEGRDSTITGDHREVLVADVAPEGKGTLSTPKKSKGKDAVHRYPSSEGALSPNTAGEGLLPPPQITRLDTDKLGLPQVSLLPELPQGDDTDIGGPPLQRSFSGTSIEALKPVLADLKRPILHKDVMADPLSDAFHVDIWDAVAKNNTKLYRQVFRCQPDSEVKDWKGYNEFNKFSEEFNQSMGAGKSKQKLSAEAPDKTGPPGTGNEGAAIVGNLAEKIDVTLKEKVGDKVHNLLHSPTNHGHASNGSETLNEKASIDSRPGSKSSKTSKLSNIRGTGVDNPALVKQTSSQEMDEKAAAKAEDPEIEMTAAGMAKTRERGITYSETTNGAPVVQTSSKDPSRQVSKRRRRATTRSSATPFNMLNRDDAESVLNLVQGHLVEWPYDWLMNEEVNSNWLFPVDQLAPMEIYD